MVRGNHVVVVVMGEMGVGSIAGLGGFAVADAVGEDDEILGDVEKLARAEEFSGKLRGKELVAGASGAVKDQDGVVDVAVGIVSGCAEGGVVQAQLGNGFAGA